MDTSQMMTGNFIQRNKNKLTYNQHDMLKRKAAEASSNADRQGKTAESKMQCRKNEDIKCISTDGPTLQWDNY
jgi:hypothetical protein